MPFPGFNHLFSIGDPVASRPYRGDFEPEDAALSLSRAEAINPPVARVTWASGAAEPGPVIWTTFAHPILIHASVVDALNQNQFTGWKTYNVQVFAKSGRHVADYFGLAITGRCDRVDLARSSIVVKQYPGGWYPEFHGHYFTPDSWDGSDIFMERPDHLGKVSAVRYLTDRVVRVLKRNRIGNLAIRRLTEESVSTSVYTIGNKHLLPPDFEHRVAAAYRSAGVPRPNDI